MEYPNGAPHCTLKPTSICNDTVLILKQIGEWKYQWKLLGNFWLKFWYPAYLTDPSTAAILKPSRISWSCSHPSSPRQLPRLTGERVDFRGTEVCSGGFHYRFLSTSYFSNWTVISHFYTTLKGSNAAFSYQNQTVVKQISAALHNDWRQTHPQFFSERIWEISC